MLGNDTYLEYMKKKASVDEDLIYWLPLDGRGIYLSPLYTLTGDPLPPYTTTEYGGRTCLELSYPSGGSRKHTSIKNSDGSDLTFTSDYTQTAFVNISAKSYNFLGKWYSSGSQSFYVSTQDQASKFTYYVGSKQYCTCNYGTWYHTAIRRSGTSIAFFLDGTKVAEATKATSVVTGLGDIMCSPINETTTSNYYSDLRAYTRALTDAEILALSQL